MMSNDDIDKKIEELIEQREEAISAFKKLLKGLNQDSDSDKKSKSKTTKKKK